MLAFTIKRIFLRRILKVSERTKPLSGVSLAFVENVRVYAVLEEVARVQPNRNREEDLGVSDLPEIGGER